MIFAEKIRTTLFDDKVVSPEWQFIQKERRVFATPLGTIMVFRIWHNA